MRTDHRIREASQRLVECLAALLHAMRSGYSAMAAMLPEPLTKGAGDD
jgi:hypothetical protein